MNPIFVLMRHHWRRHRVPLIVMSAALGLFEFLITRLAPAPNELNWMAGLLRSMPPQVIASMGGPAAIASSGGVLAVGYSHPFFFLMLSVWVVRVPSAAFAGEIGQGTMDLIGSRPISRWQQVVAADLFTSTGVIVMVAVAWIGTALGLATRPLGVSALEFLRVGTVAALLYIAWLDVSLLVSATRRDAGGAIAWTSGILATSFVLEYLARLWDPIAALRPFSLFAYYQPLDLVNGWPSLGSLAVLALTATAALGVAIAIFQRRDL